MRYLFNHWDRIRENLRDKRIMLFLDYDGTLTPIVESPDKAVISQENRRLLEKLSRNQRLKLAVISGRSLKDIKRMVGIKNIIYSGNHGLEMEGPKIKFEALVTEKHKSALKQIENILKKKLSKIKGALLENKGLSLSLHYRLVQQKDIALIKTIFHETTMFYLLKNIIKLKSGKMVFEIRPPVEWDKGKIVLWLLTRQKFLVDANKFLAIYIGDDATDEDAFRVMQNKGLTIFVGKPKPSSCAEYYLMDTKEVSQFLNRISNL